MNGAMPVVSGVAANTFPVCTSRAASRARAPADILMLDPYGSAARGRDGGTAAAAGLDGRLGVDRQDPVAGLQPPALVVALVEVQDHGRPGFEVRGAGRDPGLVLPGLDRCSARIRSTEDTDRSSAVPARVSSASSSGPVQRDSGTPVAAGSWHASATTAARVSSLIRRGRPGRAGLSARPGCGQRTGPATCARCPR